MSRVRGVNRNSAAACDNRKQRSFSFVSEAYELSPVYEERVSAAASSRNGPGNRVSAVVAVKP
jgi:hypothetical protein